MTDLAHYGVKRKSGRYPWGSGKDPHQHSGDLLSTIKDLKAKGLSETDRQGPWNDYHPTSSPEIHC